MDPRRSPAPTRSPARLGSWGMLFAAALLWQAHLRAEELLVGPGSELRTISRALGRASAGDTILVEPGEYRERLVIREPVKLIGRGRPRLVGDREDNVILVLADGARVEGFSISRSGNDMMVSDAGIKVRGRKAVIRDNLITDCLFGIYLDGSLEALVEGNTIRGQAEKEIGQRGAGVHFYDAHHNVVRGNDIADVRDGVYFDHSDFNTVEENEFSSLRYGVHYMYCADNSFFRNVFRDSVAGVAVMYTERVVFRGNHIFNNRRGYNAFGLLLKECLDSTAEGNVIVNNVRGVFLDSSHRNRFRRNLIAYNDVGVVLYASSLENSFSSNDFIANMTTLHTVGRAKADWSPGGRGNYYSDYSGYDLQGDGIGDIPHRLQDPFEYLEGSRPLLRIFLNSAAADALAAAEKTFPLVPSSDQKDRAPRMEPVSGVRLARRPSGDQPAGGTAAAAGFGAMALGCLWLGWRLRR